MSVNAKQLIYEEYMSNIIKQLPLPGQVNLLSDTSSAQASFYFQSSSNSKYNASLYNSLLGQRIKATDKTNDVQKVELAQNIFTNDYNDVYLKIVYNLSQADEAEKQLAETKANNAVGTLTPTWNDWWEAMHSIDPAKVAGIPKLNTKNRNIALTQMTYTLNNKWVAEHYRGIIQEDPGYPYAHMNNFGKIFGKIPSSVSMIMRSQLKSVYNAQGAAGRIIAMVANATQTLAGIKANIQQPSADNGGIELSSNKFVPGLDFTPANPQTIATSLGRKPASNSYHFSRSVTKQEGSTLKVEASAGASFSIPILDFFTLDVSGSAKGSIFNEDYAGVSYSIGVKLSNVTTQPVLGVKPLLYSTATSLGWMSSSPVLEAIKNGTNNTETGYRFTSIPNYNFKDNGDFGYIKTLVLSQFLELDITFNKCDSTEVKKYFEQHTSATISFLGIPLGGARSSSSYSYEYSSETATSITVSIKPVAPGYTPGVTDITQSLCQLVGVGVEYPFAS